VRKSSGISLECFSKRKQEVTEGGGYGMLVVSIAGHDRRAMFLSLLEKYPDEKDYFLNKLQSLVPEIKAHVEDNLVVPTSTRMDLSPGFDPHSFNDIALNVGMDIFLRRIQSKLSRSMKRFYFLQRLEDPLSILLREDTLSTEHENMGAVPPQIVRDQPFIAGRNPPDISPRKKFDHLLRREFFKPLTPQFLHPHFQSPTPESS
jgi:hypothetical protein